MFALVLCVLAAEPISDIGVMRDYRNEVKGDTLYLDKTLTIEAFVLDIVKQPDGSYVARTWWQPDGPGTARLVCCHYRIPRDNAAGFADARINSKVIVIKARCVGLRGGRVWFEDATFVGER